MKLLSTVSNIWTILSHLKDPIHIALMANYVSSQLASFFTIQMKLSVNGNAQL